MSVSAEWPGRVPAAMMGRRGAAVVLQSPVHGAWCLEPSADGRVVARHLPAAVGPDTAVLTFNARGVGGSGGSQPWPGAYPGSDHLDFAAVEDAARELTGAAELYRLVSSAPMSSALLPLLLRLRLLSRLAIFLLHLFACPRPRAAALAGRAGGTCAAGACCLS